MRVSSMNELDSADVVIVGAGILGLACAYTAVRRGLKVVAAERMPRAMGASVRNFGMVWPVGQPPGRVRNRAVRSRELWQEMLDETGLWSDACGSLHLAHSEEEEAVLAEFCQLGPDHGYSGEFLTASEAMRRFPALQEKGLRAAMFNSEEICVDPRRITWDLPEILSRSGQARFHFSTAVTAIVEEGVMTARGLIRARNVIVCSGSDFESLYPNLYAEAGLLRCKLQMMRTAPQANDWRIGTMIAGGLTLLHYGSFEICPSLAALQAVHDRDFAEHQARGIHVMASQNALGEVVIGDSHEYGLDLEPFDSLETDRLILDYLQRLINLPEPAIAERWNGIYTKQPDLTEFLASPEENVWAASFTSGNGMTTSFAFAEEIFEEIFPS